MLDRYRMDAADQFAGAIGLFGFLALIPLLLLTVALGGFLLRDPADQIELVTALTEALPGFAATLGDQGIEGFVDGIVERRATITTVGLVTLLVTGLRPVTAATVATTTIFRAPLPQGAGSKLRSLGALVALGAVALAGVATSSLVGIAGVPAFARIAVSVGATYLLDVVLFFTAYTLLSPGSRVRGRALLPGAALAAAGWTALKLAGSAYVSNQVADANALYGAVGSTIAAVLLLYLAGRLYLYGAELAAVRYEAAHGPIPLPPGTATLARIDDPLPDGRELSSESPAGKRRAPSVTVPVSTDPATEQVPVVTVADHRARSTDGPRGAGARRAVGLGVGLAAAAAAAKLWRDDHA